MTSISSNNRTSHLVASQLPGYVRDDHPTFVQFLEAYYKWMEEEGNLTYVTKNFTNYLDIDQITKDFLEDTEVNNPSYYVMRERLYQAYIKFFPENTAADRDVILKHARDFYRASGTEKSVQFLLRALYGKESYISYPKDNILKVSDGKWYIEKTLNIKDVKVNNVANSIAYTRFTNTSIRGAVSNSSATVETINAFYENGILITELRLSAVEQDFENGEELYTLIEDEGIEKRLSANLFSGIVTNVYVRNPGAAYVQGASVPVIANDETGSGAQVIISKVNRSYLEGKIKGVNVVLPGAGFRANDQLLFAGGGGRFATGNVFSVNPDETYHPSSYQICGDIIALEANTPINATSYANLNNANANSVIGESWHYWNYDNCGPIVACAITNPGTGYIEIPSVDVVSNTIIRSMGILGRLEIIDGGFGYVVDDEINIINRPGSYGSGAKGQVSVVDANGTITQVDWNDQVEGFLPGGSGYNPLILPDAVIISQNAQAYGANVMVTAVLGDNEVLQATANVLGSIERLTVVSGGVGYQVPPTLDLSTQGDGTAQATANIVTGIYTYPGRYLNDDGQLSAFKFLQDRDYYQNYSYVVNIDESINKYRFFLNALTHPAGSKMFGEYTFVDEALSNDDGVDIEYSNNFTNYANTLNNTVFLIDAANSACYDASSIRLNVFYSTATANDAGAFRRANGNYFKITSYAFSNGSNIVVNLANTSQTGNLENGSYYTSGSFNFDGQNDLIRFSHNNSLNVASGLDTTMTAIVWFTPGNTVNGVARVLLSKADALSTRGYWLYQSAANLHSWVGSFAPENYIVANNAVQPNTWYQFAITYDGGNIRMFKNGDMIAMSPGGANGYPDTSDELIIGAEEYLTPNSHLGRISVVEIHDRQLSNSEIQHNFNKYRGRYGL